MGHKLLWVVDFPMFKYDEETKKYAAEHHPFTMIPKSDWDKIETDPMACGSYSYDIVMDGFEAGGGSIRIHNAELQKRVLKRCGVDDEDMEVKFGHLIHALELGRPRMAASLLVSTAWSCCWLAKIPSATSSPSRRRARRPIP